MASGLMTLNLISDTLMNSNSRSRPIEKEPYKKAAFITAHNPSIAICCRKPAARFSETVSTCSNSKKKIRRERRREEGRPLAFSAARYKIAATNRQNISKPPGVYTSDIYLQFRCLNVQRPRTMRSSVRLKCER